MDRLEYAFVIFFITLGPIKCMAPFLQLTANFDARTKRSLALRGSLIAALVGLFIVFVGNSLREKWQIGQPDLMITFGILLLISALQQLTHAEHASESGAPPTDPAGLALSPIAFPIIITPYGIAALLLFAAVAEDREVFLTGVFGLFLALMAVNAAAMIFARQILFVVRPQILRAFGWVLGVLQASLAVYAIMSGLRLGFPTMAAG